MNFLLVRLQPESKKGGIKMIQTLAPSIKESSSLYVPITIRFSYNSLKLLFSETFSVAIALKSSQLMKNYDIKHLKLLNVT